MNALSAACTVLILIFGCVKTDAKVFAYQSRVGVVDRSPGNEMCLTIPNANLTEGSRVHIVAPHKPQSLAVAVIQKKLTESCSPNPDTSADASFYSLKVVRGKIEPGSVGIGVIGANINFKVTNGLANADLNGDGIKEYFRSCTSREGLHFTIWSGKPLRGTRRWHWYYYLGYDVEPSCTSREAR